MSTFDETVDVVVVGSGAAGAVAALKARDAGLEVVVLEATELLGGNSAISGGGIWIPNNHVARRAGQSDSHEDARTYMDACIGDVGPASSPARREAFLTQGPQMLQWLEDLGMKWVFTEGYADYYPERPGGRPNGRGIEAKKYDIKRLGPWADKLRFTMRDIPMYTGEVKHIATSFRTCKGFLTAARIVGLEATIPRLVGKQLVGLGNGLMGRLLEIMVAKGVQFRLSSPMRDLIVEDGRVTGVLMEHEGRQIRLGARRGVILTSGGFERNKAMRERYQEAPVTDAWTSGTEGNKGLPIEMAHKAGAALALMDDAWWGPTTISPDGEAAFMVSERSLPHCIIVDETGRRFMNESESYVDAGHKQYERNRTVKAIPAWMILDSRHRRYYPFGAAMPGKSGTRKLVESGYFVQAESLPALAAKIGVDAEGLVETAARFSEFARTGEDLDFGRGNSAYDRVYGDPRVKPNPNLGAIDTPPFYAVKVYPGDLGTKGGILTDEHARALREDGSVIEGLYAAGNCSASVMGRTYPGPGSTLGPAMTFGFIGASHMSEAQQ